MTDFNPNNPYDAPKACDFAIKNIYFCVPMDTDYATDTALKGQLLDVMPQYYKLQYESNLRIFGVGAPQVEEYNVAWYTLDSAGARTLHWAALEDFTFDLPQYPIVAP